MNILRDAHAGTLESNDVMVFASPHKDGIVIELESIVGRSYGDHITAMVRSQLADLGVTAVKLKLNDRGAVDFAIKARVETALRRAGKEEC